ncbi:MAG TPA: hypothetical protein DHN33_05975 [Eubacteriaceae bacterium]|nr:hypothetical protein [Eubacteriaceae bacterium]
MDRITNDELASLIDHSGKPSISIYFNLPNSPTNAEKNKVELKNLLKSAQKELVHNDVLPKVASKLLEPGYDLLDQSDFWMNTNATVGLFISKDRTTKVTIPIDVEPTLYIGPAFYTIPIFKFLSINQDCYILSLSQNNTRLFHSNLFDCVEQPLGDMPKSLEEALKYDDFEKNKQFMKRDAGTAGEGTPGVYRGQGDGRDEHKTNLLRFMEIVEKEIYDRIKNERKPVFLAGVEYLASIFKKTNPRIPLKGNLINGNFDHHSENQFLDLIRPQLYHVFVEEVQKQLEHYKDLQSTDKASDDLLQIVSNAKQGKVETLFVTENHFVSGIFNDTLFQASEKEKSIDTTDLMNMSAVETYNAGGRVYVVEPSLLGQGLVAAAIYRY